MKNKRLHPNAIESIVWALLIFAAIVAFCKWK